MKPISSDVTEAISRARQKHTQAIQAPPPTLFDPPPPAHPLTHKNAGRSELDAQQRATVTATAWKGRVYQAIREAGAHGLTVFELHQRLGGIATVELNTIQPRTCDLRDDGLIVATDTQRTTIDPATGRSRRGAVWVAVEHRPRGTQ